MSASPPPTPDELAERFPISAMEAQAIADAMTPLQNFTNVGSSVGNTLEDVPGPGPKLVGAILRDISTQVNLASQSFETIARAIDFYATAQGGAFEELFPPPQELAAQLEQQADMVIDSAAALSNQNNP